MSTGNFSASFDTGRSFCTGKVLTDNFAVVTRPKSY